ncbi:MAG: amidohydrolase family protein [Candidatus Nitrosocaldus sp.]|nr:amidohydrolase family protein [Candidatus Nitrosocaldus sp.]
MYIRNISILYGSDLEFVAKASVTVNESTGTIQRVERGSTLHAADTSTDTRTVDGEGLLMIPSFINAHTHIADSIAKDVAYNLGFNESIHPVFGVKRKVLNESRREHIMHFIRSSALSMLSKGITMFIDFREQGLNGVNMLRESMNGVVMRYLALGRVEHYSGGEEPLTQEALEDAFKVADASDGFGLSGANEYSSAALKQIAMVAASRNKLFGMHACESEESQAYSMERFGMSEASRILGIARPDFLVHMTVASDSDLMVAASKDVGIVVCPRANAVLGVGIPRVWDMLRLGCTVAIGTDNVMLNTPDIFREMDYIWKLSRVMYKGERGRGIDARDVLKMVTVNPARIFRLNRLGYLEEGMYADALFIDKYSLDIAPMHNPYTAIVHRAGESSIRAVMLNGRVVHGRLE